MIVIHDVMPQYISASRALNACAASPGTALQFLLDARMYGPSSIHLSAD